MGMSIDQLKPLLEQPECPPDVPMIGTYQVELLRTGQGADGIEYAKVRLFDYTGSAQTFIRRQDWSPQLRKTPTVRTVGFKFVPARDGELVPIGFPAEDMDEEHRSAIELLPAHVSPDPGDLERFLDLANSLSVLAFRQFLESVFSDPEFAWAFVTLPAGRTCHHVFTGGLLKHSLEVAEGIQAVVNVISSNRVMGEAAVVTGLLHDIGKVLFSRPDAYRIPCLPHQHGSLIQYALLDSLSWLWRVDRDAHDALWRVITAYQNQQHYDVPLAALVQAADSVSAQHGALSPAEEPKGGYWKRGCGRNRIWQPPDESS